MIPTYSLRVLGENPTEDEVKELEEELCSKDGLDNTEKIIESATLTSAYLVSIHAGWTLRCPNLPVQSAVSLEDLKIERRV